MRFARQLKAAKIKFKRFLHHLDWNRRYVAAYHIRTFEPAYTDSVIGPATRTFDSIYVPAMHLVVGFSGEGLQGEVRNNSQYWNRADAIVRGSKEIQGKVIGAVSLPVDKVGLLTWRLYDQKAQDVKLNNVFDGSTRGLISLLSGG
jgi:hypothetical protein